MLRRMLFPIEMFFCAKYKQEKKQIYAKVKFYMNTKNIIEYMLKRKISNEQTKKNSNGI